MKVILAVDESPHSRAALEFILRAHWPKGSRFTVLSAVPILTPAYSLVEAGGHSLAPEILERGRRAHQELAAGVERELREAGLTTQSKVELGDAREVILRVAGELQADLIVLGSHGRSGLRKLLMGSVASHVMTHAPCSVLVVKMDREPGSAS